MPKAARVREGAGYLPRIDIGDLRRMRDLLPCGKPRLRVQAAILRKGGRERRGHGGGTGGESVDRTQPAPAPGRGGLCRICDGPGTGRPCRLADDERPRLELFICNGPQACGYARDNWTAGLLVRHIARCLGEAYGASDLLDLVSPMGYPVREQRPVPHRSASPGERAEFRGATRLEQTEHRKRGHTVLCFEACAKTRSPSARRGIRTRGGSDTVSTNHSRKGMQMLGMPGDGTLDLMFSETYNSGDTMRMIRHVHKKYEKVYCMRDNAGPNTAAAVLKYAAESGGDAVLRHILPYTPQLSPIGPQWAATKGGVGGTYFGDFGSMQRCIRDALENGEIPVVRLQEYLTDTASPRGDASVKVICTVWRDPPCVLVRAGPGARSRVCGNMLPPTRWPCTKPPREAGRH